MGVDFQALVGHNFDFEDLLTLPDHLNRTWSQVQEFLPIIEGYPAPNAKAPRQWQWKSLDGKLSFEKELETTGSIWLDGPDGFFFSVGVQAIVINHGCRWWHYLTDSQVRHKLGQVCHHIGRVAVSDLVIYIPDSFYECSSASDLVDEGKSIAEILAWLHGKVGNPARDCSDITPEERFSGWGGNRYFVEEVELKKKKPASSRRRE
ncbi:MAG: hypothetical protein K1Y36_05540 [Blastocatellia bacterium]|nr:hypothetical protein [Blastocatellia bacterium]